MSIDYKKTLEMMPTIPNLRTDDQMYINAFFNWAHSNYVSIRSALTLATKAEQLRNDYTSIGVTLAARNSEIKELKAKLEKAKWQPIETAPKDDFIIVTDGGFYAQAFWNNDKWMMGFIDGAINVKVDLYPTHWMPLPDAPEKL